MSVLSVEQLAAEHGWKKENGGDPVLHLDALLHTLEIELSTLDLVLGMAGEGRTRFVGDRVTRVRVLLTELNNYRSAARAAAEVR